MYIKIKNNKLTDWAEWSFEGSTFIDVNKEYYDNNQDKYKVFDGELVDISDTEEYQNLLLQKEIEAKKEQIISQLEELDKASIRPLRSGETERLAELEAQAKELRKQLSN